MFRIHTTRKAWINYVALLNRGTIRSRTEKISSGKSVASCQTNAIHQQCLVELCGKLQSQITSIAAACTPCSRLVADTRYYAQMLAAYVVLKLRWVKTKLPTVILCKWGRTVVNLVPMCPALGNVHSWVKVDVMLPRWCHHGEHTIRVRDSWLVNSRNLKLASFSWFGLAMMRRFQNKAARFQK